ncbi:hypothetical protein [Saccharopolyspora erythraea]|uniref:Uncharacterized protein n=1 Tax=Saccharopolyspora erythraea TaxID=1836 RepID=A0ABN1EDL3_SACER|nr:hypothetical protein [Saccharopolyspora erythraea]QRK92235.1 hypothetical protein JQX30_13410 [Saccharopolyspora erythraea]
MAACLLAAAEPALARSGRRPEVALDSDHVVAAVRSDGLLRDPRGQGVNAFAPIPAVWGRE